MSAKRRSGAAKVRRKEAGGGKGLLRGRFEGEVHPALDAINRSFEVDVRLWCEDIDGSIAHAEMLGAVGVLEKAAVARILAGLRADPRRVRRGARSRPGRPTRTSTWPSNGA